MSSREAGAACDYPAIVPFNPRRLPGDWSTADEALLQAIDDATATPVTIAYQLAPEWAEGVHAALDDVEAGARPHVAIELVAHALTRVDRAEIDDSDGWLTDLSERLVAMFYEAARAAGLAADDISARRDRLRSLDLAPFDGEPSDAA